jgi:lactosylceramide 4-alpha-galactosyltransferase
MNPFAKIFVLFLSTAKHIRIKNYSQFQSILDYENVHLMYFNIDDLIANTRIEQWIRNGLLNKSKFKVVHTSDILRYVLLHKFSGIYLDLDVLVMQAIKQINSKNFACLQEDGIVNNAIIRLDGEVGRNVSEIFIK